VESETFSPRLKKRSNGCSSYSRNSELLLIGDMACKEGGRGRERERKRERERDIVALLIFLRSNGCSSYSRNSALLPINIMAW